MSANLKNSVMVTGLKKVNFSFQSPKKKRSKNAQTTAQFHSSHMLVK